MIYRILIILYPYEYGIEKTDQYAALVKNLLRNQKANGLESWFTASGVQVHVLPSLFK